MAETNMKKVIERLNQALMIEYSAVIQYTQFAALIQGPERQLYRTIFEGSSKEARDHAGIVSDLIVSIGGTPTVETAKIRQSADPTEMLRFSIATEKEVMGVYQSAHDLVVEECALKYMLEERVMAEQEDVWQFEKLLKLHAVKVARKEINLADAS